MTNKIKNRPISPHLTIYKPQLNSVLSIMHRITGITLLVGLLILTAWFFALSLGEKQFRFIDNIVDSIIFQLILLGSLGALWFHFFAGIRHLFWDIGLGFNLKSVQRSSYAVLIFTIIFFLASITLANL